MIPMRRVWRLTRMLGVRPDAQCLVLLIVAHGRDAFSLEYEKVAPLFPMSYSPETPLSGKTECVKRESIPIPVSSTWLTGRREFDCTLNTIFHSILVP